MQFSFSDLLPNAAYHFITQAIIPRPVAWILTANGNETFNLAPFSFFNGVTSDPPIVSFSVGHKSDGSKKDTWLNIESRDYFVVHIPSVSDAEAVSQTSKTLPFGVSEVDDANLSLKAIPDWPLPVLQDAGLAFLGKKHAIHLVGNGPQALILGEMLHAYVDDEICATDANGRFVISSQRLNPLARLGGGDYAGLGKTFTIPRPL